ncbi:hypothetical protein RhiirA5_494048 [Rhizophagus irregularis]|uniref:Uncharacterized protein n=3 Tax=Rhizophagus irregularis TaxID=588596 RepID=U9UHT5_RHIID|nr:hypothetical protein GLOIN_2v1553558 [Rhizophagus irregularis DAOM 181602=DAOM 197198]EXX78713.1 hypothetical protein RirG_012660 [Rhizophagus irregularis DAOM 197198w]PKC16084.1 hypothetical protein RhiirA5_494048 [Rhizophagus irregularis]PKC76212.1 hypothetical protein RhiirA1_406587 [Rhizophagus irregularis]PKY15039.1 hypothetical protein RhiirB3_401045 [Rhizophagus irregularis]POG76708.1 hypothetical protein GLOIN_2v1553558 [Rhizophagus irregularis DAOM 181602=DAOM 197198]|eukprot:XP_025183574.1 hypothetical protein GLOIN_2v1553558 [Rhizophagus irregularis DAOM 181602=DAOM 197198]
MASNTDFISRLRTLKLAYDEKLITKDEYDKCRLKELDNWSENQEEKKSFWGNLWDKACKLGSAILRNMIRPIVEGTLLLTGSIFKLISPKT